MKTMKITAIVVLLCFIPCTAFAENRPYIPATTSALSSTLSTIRDIPQVLVSSRFSISPSNFRGNFAESLMRNYLTSGADLSSGKAWFSLASGAVMVKRGGTMTLLDPSKTGRAGFDGLFMQFNAKGNPTGIMVAESKFGSSQLGRTKYFGKQMSNEWVQARAQKAALHYKRMSSLIKGGRLQRSSILPTYAKITGRVTQVPLSNKESVSIWWDKTTSSYVYYSDNPISSRTLQQAVDKISQVMDRVANGKILPRKVLWHVDANKTSIRVTRESINADGEVIQGSKKVIDVLSKPYANLSLQNQALIDEGVIDAISRQHYGYLPDDLAREAALSDWNTAKAQGKAEQFIREYNPDKPKFAWKVAGTSALKAGLIGAAFALAFSAGANLFSSMYYGTGFDYKSVMKDITLGFISAGAGTFAGMGTSYLLSNSQSLLAQMIPQSFSALLSGTISGLIASAIFSYGYALLNNGNLAEGNRLMITGLAATTAGALAGYAIIQTAMLVGTASTGTAISTLSGAVATKAAMAWLGGGAVSAGGWGVAGGTLVLSGGTLIAILGVSAAINYGWSLLKEEERVEHLKYLVENYR